MSHKQPSIDHVRSHSAQAHVMRGLENNSFEQLPPPCANDSNFSAFIHKVKVLVREEAKEQAQVGTGGEGQGEQAQAQAGSWREGLRIMARSSPTLSPLTHSNAGAHTWRNFFWFDFVFPFSETLMFNFMLTKSSIFGKMEK